MQVNRDYLQAKGGFPCRDPFAGDGIEAGDAKGSAALLDLRQAISSYSALNEFRLPPGIGNVRFIAGAKHGPASLAFDYNIDLEKHLSSRLAGYDFSVMIQVYLDSEGIVEKIYASF